MGERKAFSTEIEWDKERGELIERLHKQMEVEGSLAHLYEETEEEIQSSPVRHLLHTIQLDSLKHMDILQVVVEVLHGEDVLKKEKEDIIKGLQLHIKLEKECIDVANKILNSSLIQHNKGLEELVKRWRNDEKEHHKMLMKLKEKTFFRTSDFEFKGTEELEERYMKTERKKKVVSN